MRIPWASVAVWVLFCAAEVGLFAAGAGAQQTPAGKAQANPQAKTQTAPPGKAQARPAGKKPAGPEVRFEPWTGDLDGMLQRRRIRVLVAFSRTQYYVVQGIQRGIAYEEVKAFESYLNVKHPQKSKNLRLHAIFIPVARDKLMSKLADGTGDVAVAELTITPEREKVVDFAAPSVSGINEIVVTGPVSPEISKVEDLAGQTVYLRKSSSYWTHAEQLNERFKREGKPAMKLRAVPEDLEDDDLLEMVAGGLLPIIFCDDFEAKLWSKLLPKLKLHPDITINTGGDFGWALRKNTPKLMAAVNDFMKTHRQGTVFGNTLLRKYTVSTQMLRSSLTPAEKAKFDRMAAIFQKYSSRYDLDHLLMMAQGYQESGLNQEARSKVGAIGIMQIMPATGEELKVGDIRQMEPNIHGGVKYIRRIVDKHVADGAVDELNKLLLAFAAYNAGPGRLQQLRKEAEAKGFNPGIWTDHVEMIAAARIGAETVTYVSNIYKYYVAYKLADEEEQERRKAREAMQGKPN